MAKRKQSVPAEVRKRLHRAILNRDPDEMLLAMLHFPTNQAAIREATRFMHDETPADTRAWWLDELCDLPHDPGSELNEAWRTALRFDAERRSN